MFIFVVLPFIFCFAFHCFSGAGRAAGPLCVCVCGQTVAFVLNDFVSVVFISVVSVCMARQTAILIEFLIVFICVICH